MKKSQFHILSLSCKIILACVLFVLCFHAIQFVLVPKFINESTTMVDDYRKLEENSLEVLFVGSSQMFCTVDSGRLTHEFAIESYNYGASGQPLSITAYYLKKALKTQKPKLVMVECGNVLWSWDTLDDRQLAWNYYPLAFSIDKYQSLLSTTEHDVIKSLKYSLCPILNFHDRWNTINTPETEYFRHYFFEGVDANRGFLAREKITKLPMQFYSGDESLQEFPEKSDTAIKEIMEQCWTFGIDVIFFKAPVSNWTKGDSLTVKKYMEENQLQFMDLHDHLDEIKIDPDSDFYDLSHLNASGAEKTTEYMAKLLSDYLAE